MHPEKIIQRIKEIEEEKDVMLNKKGTTYIYKKYKTPEDLEERNQEKKLLIESELIESDFIDNIEENLSRLDTQHRKLINELMTYDEYFNRMRMWIINIVGVSSQLYINNIEEAEEILSQPDGLDFKSVGNHLGNSVLKNIEKNNIGKIDNYGYGCGSWFISVLCTSEESKKLIEITKLKYKKQLDAEMLRIRKIFWQVSSENIIGAK